MSGEIPWYDTAEWESLCAGVTAAPDDDLTRLVAADWLEEWGGPGRESAGVRARLIRSQVDNPGDTAWGLSMIGDSPADRLVAAEARNCGLESVNMVRGFPDAARVQPHRFTKRAAARLMRLTPVRWIEPHGSHPEEIGYLGRLHWAWAEGFGNGSNVVKSGRRITGFHSPDDRWVELGTPEEIVRADQERPGDARGNAVEILYRDHPYLIPRAVFRNMADLAGSDGGESGSSPFRHLWDDPVAAWVAACWAYYSTACVWARKKRRNLVAYEYWNRVRARYGLWTVGNLEARITGYYYPEEQERMTGAVHAGLERLDEFTREARAKRLADANGRV